MLYDLKLTTSEKIMGLFCRGLRLCFIYYFLARFDSSRISHSGELSKFTFTINMTSLFYLSHNNDLKEL